MNDDLRLLWQRLKDHLLPALEREGNLFTPDDVWTAVEAGQAQFWPAPNSVAITEIKVYPRAKVLNVWLAGGKLDEIIVLVEYMKKFGKAQGCSRITMTGRPGWTRVMGMTPTSVTLSEPL